ncbi:hypothetical protein Pryu01_01814 [Paraliobacillus ryukyuensis]|uniref:Adenylate kinase family enzyme n=1 Tax=Paraliobacillus ryukyuensis TaxID=200904 RepID=A0A366E7G1_9BACI|nr:DNA topology modulation protein [Paraliobacillus ryukyuensis]RBO98330.1 adenylate kinase family enzyme [Paraliobacillus ryukyuensis]
MKKIIIVGSGGAGKSTLAQQLGDKLHIPVHHLDSYFWKPNWVSISREELVDIQLGLMQQDSWIVDGNYSGTLDLRLKQADTVIFLNYPTWRCLYGIVKRRIQYHNKTRPDMGEGCTEKLDMEFFKWVARFQKDKAPKLKRKIKAASHINYIELNSPKQTHNFLQHV